MSTIKIGCQTYTWEMLGEQWKGSVDDILDAVAGAGYEGIEITNAMIGDYYPRPGDFAAALARRGLRLAAFAYGSPTGFSDPANWEAERAEAMRAVAFTAHFPGVPLCLGGAASPSREDLSRKHAQAAKLYSAVAREGRARGVTVALHPHSHHGSLLESAQEYATILALTAEAGVQFNPDSGHIVRGGQELLGALRAHLGRVVHVHIKDADAAGDWQPLGQGVCDFPGLFRVLEEAGYQGWVVAEEESAAAWADPQAAIAANRQYLRELGY